MSNNQLFLFCVLTLIAIPSMIRASYEWFWKPNHHVAKHYVHGAPKPSYSIPVPKRGYQPIYGSVPDSPRTGSNTK